MHIEYPKKMYHKDGRQRRVGTVEDQVQYEEGWGESPAGPFNETPLVISGESTETINAEQDPDAELTAAIQGRRGPGRPRRQPEG